MIVNDQKVYLREHVTLIYFKKFCLFNIKIILRKMEIVRIQII